MQKIDLIFLRVGWEKHAHENSLLATLLAVSLSAKIEELTADAKVLFFCSKEFFSGYCSFVKLIPFLSSF